MSADWASYSVNLTQNGWNQHIGPRILWTKHKMDEKLQPNFTSFSKEQWLCIPMIFFFIEVISSFIRFTSMESALSPVGPSTERTWSCKAFVESMRENYSQSFISRQYLRLRVVANFGEIHIREWATYTHHARRGGHETRRTRRGWNAASPLPTRVSSTFVVSYRNLRLHTVKLSLKLALLNLIISLSELPYKKLKQQSFWWLHSSSWPD